MLHMTVGIFGNAEHAKRLGKQGTVNDISIFNHGSSDGVLTYVAVSSEKVQPLLQVISMIDVPVFVISEINAALGEQIIAVSEAGFGHGFVMLDGLHEDQVKPLFKGTCLEKFMIVGGTTELVEELKKLKIDRSSDKLVVPVDNYFDVKSVGTVILGIIKSGAVKKYDKVVVEPIEREVTVKGIQSQDRDIESAEAGMRIGLNLKGIEAEELKRGYIIGQAAKARTLKLRFTKSRFCKDEIKARDSIFVASGMQVATVHVTHVSDFMEVESDVPIVHEKDTKFILASTKQALPRILGTATLL